MIPWQHDAAAVCYALAVALAWLHRRTAVPWLIGVGALLHAVAFFDFHRVEPPIPLVSTAAAISLVGWLAASAYLLGLRLPGVRDVGGWVGAAAALLTVVGSLGLRLRTGIPEAQSGALPHAHVILGAAGLGILGLSSLAGACYLAKERSLKAKRGPALDLPSLESLDRLGYLGLALGFPLLTLAVVTGFLWIRGLESPMWSQHGVLSTIGWVVYLIPVALRLVRGDRGARTARVVVVGFVVLALSYVGVRVLELRP